VPVEVSDEVSDDVPVEVSGDVLVDVSCEAANR